MEWCSVPVGEWGHYIAKNRIALTSHYVAFTSYGFRRVLSRHHLARILRRRAASVFQPLTECKHRVLRLSNKPSLFKRVIKPCVFQNTFSHLQCVWVSIWRSRPSILFGLNHAQDILLLPLWFHYLQRGQGRHHREDNLQECKVQSSREDM